MVGRCSTVFHGKGHQQILLLRFGFANGSSTAPSGARSVQTEPQRDQVLAEPMEVGPPHRATKGRWAVMSLEWLDGVSKDF